MLSLLWNAIRARLQYFPAPPVSMLASSVGPAALPLVPEPYTITRQDGDAPEDRLCVWLMHVPTGNVQFANIPAFLADAQGHVDSIVNDMESRRLAAMLVGG